MALISCAGFNVKLLSLSTLKYCFPRRYLARDLHPLQAEAPVVVRGEDAGGARVEVLDGVGVEEEVERVRVDGARRRRVVDAVQVASAETVCRNNAELFVC